MKTLFLKLLPGVAACLALCLGLGWVRAQTTQTAPQTVPVSGAQYSLPSQSPQQAPAQVIVCGSCGAQVGIPQPVLVAMPVGGQQYYGQPAAYQPAAYYDEPYRPGAPPQSIYGLSTQWRASPWSLPPSGYYGHRHGRECGPRCRY